MRNEKPARILVVDDDPTHFKVVLDNFQDDDFEIMYAPNGREGCNVAEKELPDLIIMDWEMPVMNGVEAITQLQSKSSTKDVPVVMATGVMTESKDLKEAMEIGAIDFIRKPFDKLELVARVKTSLRLSDSYQLIKKQNKDISSLMEQEMALKDRELLLETMHRLENSNFINRLGESLANIEKQCKDQNSVQDIIKLTKEINSHLRTESNWENFTIHFKKVHPNFFRNLMEKYPDITPNEQRLCAYVKIGLNNKEVAQLLGVTVGTTKTNLNRLKKRLSLQINESLRDFITTFSYANPVL